MADSDQGPAMAQCGGSQAAASRGEAPPAGHQEPLASAGRRGRRRLTPSPRLTPGSPPTPPLPPYPQIWSESGSGRDGHPFPERAEGVGGGHRRPRPACPPSGLAVPSHPLTRDFGGRVGRAGTERWSVARPTAPASRASSAPGRAHAAAREGTLTAPSPQCRKPHRRPPRRS